MGEQKTISDSKRAFYKQFPYVISPLYRRVADELLVELHLLTHKKEFKLTALFSTGLIKIFSDFTQGYQPKEHLKDLFDALCKSNSTDPNNIRQLSSTLIETISNTPKEESKNWFKGENNSLPTYLIEEINILKSVGNYYSRLTLIGLMEIVRISCDLSNSLESIEPTIAFSEKIGLSKTKTEKDLNLYKANLNKLNQAIELMNETLLSDKKRRSTTDNKNKESEMNNKEQSREN